MSALPALSRFTPRRVGFRATLLILSVSLPATLLTGCSDREAAEPETGEVVLTDGDGRRWGAAFSRDGEQVAFSANLEGEKNGAHVLSVLAGEGGRVSRESAAEEFFRWTPDGTGLVVYNYDDSELCVVDMTGRVQEHLSSPKRARPVDLAPDGTILWYKFNGDNFDIGTTTWTGDLDVTPLDQTADWELGGCFGPGPDEVTVVHQEVYATPSTEISVWSSQTGEKTALPLPVANNVHPTWSPNHQYLAYASDRSGNMDLWIYDSITRSSIQITHGPEDELHPAWSPDGSTLAFSRRHMSSHIFIGDPETYSRRELTKGDVLDLIPVVSPDGQWVVFVREMATAKGSPLPGLVVASVSGDVVRVLDLEQLIPWVSEGHYLSWSPDSKEIAFAANDGTGNIDIYRISREGNLPQRVTIDPGTDTFPEWSPDGKFIAYTQLAGGETQILVIPASGGLTRQVTQDERVNLRPIWAPDSDHLAYYSRFEDETELRVSSVSDPQLAYQVVEKGLTSYPETWSTDGTHILFMQGRDESLALYAVSLDGERVEVAQPGEGESENFWELTEAGQAYREQVYRGGVHAFADGEDRSNIHLLKVRHLIETGLHADRVGN